jgi:hypothetical protein
VTEAFLPHARHADAVDDPIGRLRHAVERIAVATAGRQRDGSTHEDAGPTSGSFDTGDAIGFDPFPLLRALHDHGATAVVIGQVAGILHGSRELTGDLDLLWDGEASGAGGMAAAFRSVNASLSDDDGRHVPCRAGSFALPKVLFRTATASGDCCTPRLPWGALDIERIIRAATVAEGPEGLLVRYVTAPDLIAMRLASGRPKDLRRAREVFTGGAPS